MRYRRLRVQDLLREEISLIIQRELQDPGLGFITVVDVRVSEDLKSAKVYISIYGSDEEQKHTLEALKRSKGYIKFLLGKRVTLRYIPELTFSLDDSLERVQRMEEIFKKEADEGKD
ncbi:MAG TPA: 30S ribosome-binding factor RbfA [Deltaproteobacteria bacterium]|nr:30S ribosome-binding factor RbfA [Deltaproteobacteria bacterium]